MVTNQKEFNSPHEAHLSVQQSISDPNCQIVRQDRSTPHSTSGAGSTANSVTGSVVPAYGGDMHPVPPYIQMAAAPQSFPSYVQYYSVDGTGMEPQSMYLAPIQYSMYPPGQGEYFFSSTLGGGVGFFLLASLRAY